MTFFAVEPGIITGPMCILGILCAIGIGIAWQGFHSKSRLP